MLGDKEREMGCCESEKNNGDESCYTGGETPVIGDIEKKEDGKISGEDNCGLCKEDEIKEDKAQEGKGAEDESVEVKSKEEILEELKRKTRELEQEIDLKNSQINELVNRLRRLQADFDNYRKRTQKEKEEMAEHAGSELIKKLLPVLDNFERALKVEDDFITGEGSFKEGIEMIYNQLKNILNEAGVEVIKTVGEQFDPTKHEAIARVESADHEDNTIIEEIRKGYKIKDKIIRPAMVKVASKKDAEK
ncbi:MAG TPA: nucleotide exchange factor GrpE [Peptococcaceae bacterium]|nr:MAG: Protein GrpE [Clostridia bacterium 41_269]HBT20317.1 nucleotide exchange factor GrpE [Peptococcaceae bacterium]